MSGLPVVPRGRTVRVTVPATSANLGAGFDTFGLALSVTDEVELTTCEPGILEFHIEGVGAESVPQTEQHLVVRALDASLAELGFAREGLRLRAMNRIPHGRGMGSSGAAIVAGVLLAAQLVGDEVDVSDERLLQLATELEGHPDNVAPCLFGGFTIAWTDGSGPHMVRRDVHADILPLVLVPEQELSTKVARSLQPAEVPHRDAVFNVARASLFVLAITEDPTLLISATDDLLHQPYRASAMQGSAELVEQLRAEHIPAVISGAGPSVLVLADSEHVRHRAMEIAAEHGTWSAFPVEINERGATVAVASSKTDSLSA